MRGIVLGFSLIELLVVIGIIAILTIVAIPNYNQYNKDQKLNEAASKLQSAIRQAQNNAQTGTMCVFGGNQYRAADWKITLKQGSYEVSSSCSDVPAYPSPSPMPTSSPQIYQLTGITISGVKEIETDCNIPFSASSGQAVIKYENISSEEEFELAGCLPGVNAVLEITLTDTKKSKIIVVEKGGGVYVKG